MNTPLHCAVYAGFRDTAKYILEKVSKPDQAIVEENGTQQNNKKRK